MKNRPDVFSIRPNVDSALARLAEQKKANGESMSPLVHQWAEKAERLAEQSQGREQPND